MLIEAGWSYRLPAREERRYRERVIDLPEDIQAIGWKAQVRLCQRYRRLAATGKPQPKVTTAIALVNWSAMPGTSPVGCRRR
jgi:transposase